MLSQFALLILGFFSQRAMNLYMGAELVGMNGVISNVINILSVTELGISTAIVYHLYGALARKDEAEIASLMNLYRKAYHVFAVLVFAAGMAVLPFIHLFMKNNSYSLSYIRVLYAMWLVRTVLSYLLTYRKSLLIADQKEYIASITGLILNVVSYLAIILLVTWEQNYLLALGIGTVTEVVLNIWISWYVEQKYPFLRQRRKEKSTSSLTKRIVRDLKSLFISRISEKMLYCTDNLIISGFIGVGTVGRYANYCMITQAISNILTILANTIQPTVGDYFTEKNRQRNYEILRQLTFGFFCIASVVSVGLFSLITPFVRDIWLGPSYELGWGITVFCIVVLLVRIMGLPLSLVMGVTGLFEKEKNVGASSALLNLIVSLALVKPYGMAGVLSAADLVSVYHLFPGFPRDAGRGAAVCAGYRRVSGSHSGRSSADAENRTTDIRSRRYASVLRLLSPVYCDSAAAGSGDLWKRLETSEHCNHGEGNAKSLMQ